MWFSGFVNKRLRASTLVETIIAMLILMISFSMIMVFFSRLFSQTTGIRKLKAEYMIMSEIQNIRKGKNYIDTEMLLEDHGKMLVTFSGNNCPEEHVMLSVIIQDSMQKILARHAELLYIHE